MFDISDLPKSFNSFFTLFFSQSSMYCSNDIPTFCNSFTTLDIFSNPEYELLNHGITIPLPSNPIPVGSKND